MEISKTAISYGTPFVSKIRNFTRRRVTLYIRRRVSEPRRVNVIRRRVSAPRRDTVNVIRN